MLIEEQRSNLLLRSSDLSNTSVWTQASLGTGGTITGNSVIAPDGTTSASSFKEGTGSVSPTVYQSSTLLNATVYTFSIYVKRVIGTRDTQLRFEAPTVNTATFNLSTVTVTNVTSGATASITSVGNGWYRLTITATSNGTFGYAQPVMSTVSGGAYTGDGISTNAYWGAQLEAGAFATSYIPTAASQVTRAADVATIQGSNFYSWYNRGEGTINSTYFFAAPTSGSINKVLAFDPIAAGSYATICVAGGAQTGWFASGLSMPTASAGVINKQAIAYNSWGGFSGALNNVLATSSTTSDYTGASTALYLGQRSNGQYMNGTIKQISYYPQRLSDSVLKGLTA